MWEIQVERLAHIGKLLQRLNESNSQQKESTERMESTWNLRRLSEPDSVQFDGKSCSLITMYAFVRHFQEDTVAQVFSSSQFNKVIDELWESAVGLHKNRNFSYGKTYLAKSKHQDGSDWLGAPWEEETVDEYA